MKDRLLRFMQSESITAGKLAEMIGVQPSAISHIISGRNKPGFDFLAGLFKKFPDLNPRWMVLGEGGMTLIPDHHYSKKEDKLLTDASPDLLRETPSSTIDITSVKTRPLNDTTEGIVIRSKSIEKIVIFYADGTFSAHERNGTSNSCA